MFNLLGAEGNNIGSIIGLVLLGVVLIGYIVFGFTNRKKQQEQAMKMMSELKQGDKVVTNAGIYGEIVSMKETNMGRVVVIKTGEDKNVSYLTINASVILGIDKKEDLILDADGNPIDTTSEKVKNDVLEEKAKEEKAEKKIARKTSRKTTKKED